MFTYVYIRISQFLTINIYTHIYICLRNIKMIYHGLDYCSSFRNKELHRALQTSISKEHNKQVCLASLEKCQLEFHIFNNRQQLSPPELRAIRFAHPSMPLDLD